MAAFTGEQVATQRWPQGPSTGRPLAAAKSRSTALRRLRRDKAMLLLAAPGVLYLLIFVYIPQLGNIIAFQNYVPFLGFRSAFVGLANFQALFESPAFWNAVRNTIVISSLQLVLYFPAPILLALLLNSVISLPVKRVIQSIVYLPHFIGWVI